MVDDRTVTVGSTVTHYNEKLRKRLTKRRRFVCERTGSDRFVVGDRVILQPIRKVSKLKAHLARLVEPRAS